MSFVADSVQILQQISYQGTVEGYGDFEIRGLVIRTVKFSGDHVLTAGYGETVLQGMIDGVTEVGRSYVMEMDVQKKL
jgi:voltage-gated potassium channel Kch